MPNINKPVALTIAGSDSGGGAGIQADLLTFTALGCHGTTAITSLTAQNPQGVAAIEAVSPDFLKAQITQVLDHFEVRAIKTGMLFNTALIQAVFETLELYPEIPLVVDPVMVATSGAVLLQEDAIEAMRQLIFPKATLITPNLDEAAVLTGRSIQSLEEMRQSSIDLSRTYKTAVILKGGHLNTENLVDILTVAGEILAEISSQRVDHVNSHGSGCKLASAIAAGLAKGSPLEESVKNAHTYLQSCFQRPIQLSGESFLSHFPDMQ